ncbi:HD family hydrolase [Providencia stuartii]
MSYISTFTGKHFDFINITMDDICIEDIAQGLSNECRFAGQINQFYSVAQHSVYVSQIVPPEYALEALLHDASEAYCKDLPSPLKALLPDYKVIEKGIQKAICYKWDLPRIISAAVIYADLTMLATERRDLEVDGDNYWPILDGIPATDLITVSPLSPIQAKAMFIYRYNQLTKLSSSGAYI